jgi:hypothetical protein
METIKIKDVQYFINLFERKKIPFTIYQTLSTTKIVTGDKLLTYTNTTNRLNNYELNLIKKVKKDALNCTDMPSTTNLDVKYIDVSKLINTNKVLTSELYELDLSSAYWNNALKNNFIEQSTFDYGKGARIGKRARLISLGALAKTTTVQNFDGTIYNDLKPIKTKTKGIFFECANICSLEMNILKILAENNFLFFWVDAVFFRTNKTKEILETYLNSKNIDYKIIALDKIQSNKKDATITVHSEIAKKPIRKFNFTKNKKQIIKIMKNSLIKFTCRDEKNNIYFTKYEIYNKFADIPTHINNTKIINRTYEQPKNLLFEVQFRNKYTNMVQTLQFNCNNTKELHELTKEFYLMNNEIYIKTIQL